MPGSINIWWKTSSPHLASKRCTLCLIKYKSWPFNVGKHICVVAHLQSGFIHYCVYLNIFTGQPIIPSIHFTLKPSCVAHLVKHYQPPGDENVDEL